MVYPALLPLMRAPRLPVVDCTGAPADLNGLDRYAEGRNLVAARVPSHFKAVYLRMGCIARVEERQINIFSKRPVWWCIDKTKR